MIAKTYAQIIGITLLLVAAVGLLFGEEPLLGILNIDIQEDVVHLVSGGLLAFVGFTKSERLSAVVVGVLGAVYLLISIIGFIFPSLLGVLAHDYSLLDNLIHLVLGIGGLAVYFMSRSRHTR